MLNIVAKVLVGRQTHEVSMFHTFPCVEYVSSVCFSVSNYNLFCCNKCLCHLWKVKIENESCVRVSIQFNPGRERTWVFLLFKIEKCPNIYCVCSIFAGFYPGAIGVWCYGTDHTFGISSFQWCVPKPGPLKRYSGTAHPFFVISRFWLPMPAWGSSPRTEWL